MAEPLFTPRAGIGARHRDPKSGEEYVFTSSGWKKMSVNIQQETTDSGAFEVKPEEKEIEAQLLQNGAQREDVERALTERRRVQLNRDSQQRLERSQEQPSFRQKDTSNPFGGMTKRMFLREAFNSGVTDIGELEKLGGIYDMLAMQDDQSSFGDVDFSNLAPQERALAREELKREVVSRAQLLETKDERESAFGAIAAFETGQQLIDAIEQGVTTGPVAGGLRKGIFGIGARNLGRTTAAEDNFASLLTLFTANFMKAISGATISDKEREYLMNALPDESKQEQANIEGIKAISQYLSTRNSNMLDLDLSPLRPQEMGGDPLGIGELGGSSNNPLGI